MASLQPFSLYKAGADEEKAENARLVGPLKPGNLDLDLKETSLLVDLSLQSRLSLAPSPLVISSNRPLDPKVWTRSCRAQNAEECK